MSNSQWHNDQVIGEKALREEAEKQRKQPIENDKLRDLIYEMWTEADSWHGPVASSHYRSRLRERATELGVKLP